VGRFELLLAIVDEDIGRFLLLRFVMSLFSITPHLTPCPRVIAIPQLRAPRLPGICNLWISLPRYIVFVLPFFLCTFPLSPLVALEDPPPRALIAFFAGMLCFLDPLPIVGHVLPPLSPRVFPSPRCLGGCFRHFQRC